MDGVRPTVSHAMFRRPAPARTGTPLWRLNRALAAPAASLFKVLGFAPGQLTLQSLTVTVVGLLSALDGSWTHLAAGAAAVYAALLLDRTDALLAERAGKLRAWSRYLRVAVQRLVEVALVGGLAVLVARGVQRGPVWIPLPQPWPQVAVAAAGALWLARSAVDQAAQTLLLREHLLSTRRLPGPGLSAGRPVVSLLSAVTGRDECILAWCLGVAVGQPVAAAVALAALHALGLLESIVLFHFRLRDPEADASRLLGPEVP